MKGLRVIKIGRSGDALARDAALEIVREYREAQKNPDGKTWCQLPSEDGHPPVLITDSRDVEPLLTALECFAETGYSFDTEEKSKDFAFIKAIDLRSEFEILKKGRKRYSSAKAIEQLAEKHGMTVSTVERFLTHAGKVAPTVKIRKGLSSSRFRDTD